MNGWSRFDNNRKQSNPINQIEKGSLLHFIFHNISLVEKNGNSDNT